MGFRLKFYGAGWIDDIDEDSGEIHVRFVDLVNKEEYGATIPIKNIIPQSEQKYAQRGAYFTIRVRRQLTFKFFKKRWSKKALRRRRKKFRFKYKSLLEKWEIS